MPRSVLIGFIFAVLAGVSFAGETGRPDGWDAASAILARIHDPQFPARDFAITDFGAVAGGADSTGAIARAIAGCHAAGGGRVVVPPGVFFTGAIVLLSNVK